MSIKDLLRKFSQFFNQLKRKISGIIALKKRISFDSGESILHNKLWTISINKPQSERFSQLSFDGFNKSRFRSYIQFSLYLPKYVKIKLSRLFRTLNRTFFGLAKTGFKTKDYLVRKLIWSRGRLSRPIANVIVMGMAFVVFMFGEVFNSSRLVNSAELDSGYLKSTTDIIPNRNTAITTIPDSRKQSEPFAYTIQSGDTLSTIGERFRISVDALKYVNGLTDASVLGVGKEIVIPPVSGLIHEVESGDTLDSIAETYDVAPQAIADFNYIINTSSLAIGTELVIPGASVPQPVIIPSITPSNTDAFVPVGPVVDPGASTDWCMWPTSVRIITQYFAWYHNGIDIAVPHGQAMPPLYACGTGTVTRAGWDPFGLGLHVRIDHGGGYETVYGHMSRLDVSFGQQVSKGQSIGLMGNTGRSTGPHVHFMVKYNGVAQNPLNYIN